MATACVFIAFKVEEAHQRVRTVVACARDAWFSARPEPAPQLTPEQLAALLHAVMETERCVQYTLEFDIGVAHPYAFIAAHLKRWKLAGAFEPAWARTAKNCDAPREVEEALSLSSNLAFQCITTGVALRCSPQDLAAAALSLAFDVLYARRGGGGGGGGGGGAAPASSLAAAAGFGGGGAARFPASPIKAHHFALCGGVSSLDSVMEVRAAIPAALALLAAGDSAVRLHLDLAGGVAPVAAAHSVEGGAAGGSGSGSGRGAGGLLSPPAALSAAASASRLVGLPLSDDLEDAPQLAPSEH